MVNSRKVPDMAQKTLSFVTALLLALLLPGCSQSIVSSSIVIDPGYLADGEEGEEGELVSQVYREAKRVGAECSLISKTRRYHLCLLQDRSGEFSVGLNHQGDFGIWISSTVVHALPPTDDSVVRGKHLPEWHKTLEKWALNLVPETTVLAARRRYVGYGVVQDLKNADLQPAEKH